MTLLEQTYLDDIDALINEMNLQIEKDRQSKQISKALRRGLPVSLNESSV